MTEEARDDRWRQVLELAHAAVDLNKQDRLAFLKASDSSPDVIQQVLTLVDEFEEPIPEEAFDAESTIGRFVITGCLGRGGMGEVYSAYDTELERTVAVKVLNRRSFDLPEAADRVIREARAASALNHPNIVTIHEVMRWESRVAIVMELVAGSSLREMCDQPLPIEQLFSIGQQTARALATAHGAGIVHRDIKPENIVVRADGTLKVLDFGLARRLTHGEGETDVASTSASAAGTWGYMSPEQCASKPATVASDIFSFGLILYELAAGRRAFPTNSPFETLQIIEEQKPTPPSRWNARIPDGFDSLVLDMLAKDPLARPSAKQVERRIVECEDTLKKPDPAFSPANRSRRYQWIAMAASLLAVAVLTWFTLRSRMHKQNVPTQITTLIPENRATAAAISPDGKFSAYANADGIFLRTTAKGETNALRTPKNFMVDKLSWFADGTKLIASGFSTNTYQPSIWSIGVRDGDARLVRADARQGVPSPDGSRVVFTDRNWSGMWISDVRGGNPIGIPAGGNGDTFSLIFWSANGRRLLFQRRHYSSNRDLGLVMLDRFYERSWEAIDIQTGKSAMKIPDLWMDSAVSLPGGRVLFLRFDQPGSASSNELWEAQLGPDAGALHGPMRKIADFTEQGAHAYGMSSTSDGNQIMFLKRTDENAVFVANDSALPPKFTDAKRLTLDERLNFPHAWTARSDAVIFESDRLGNWDIFKQPIHSRVPDPVAVSSVEDAFLPQLAPDGRSILYCSVHRRKNAPRLLMRIPVGGGVPQQVPTDGQLDEFRCAVRLGESCVIRKTVARDYYAFFELDPLHGIGRELARTRWTPEVVGDWDLSPDASLVAIPNHDTQSATIRIVRLHPRADETAESELKLTGLTDLSGVTWARDGTGWFVTLSTTIGIRLVYVYLNGHVSSLGDIQGWAVPSPDGRRVAYRDRIVAANAWLFDRR